MRCGEERKKEEEGERTVVSKKRQVLTGSQARTRNREKREGTDMAPAKEREKRKKIAIKNKKSRLDKENRRVIQYQKGEGAVGEREGRKERIDRKISPQREREVD